MKFFSWMHRKFDHNALKGDEGPRFGGIINYHVKKTESSSSIAIAIDSNTKALVEHVEIWDNYGWKNGGLLTIGTFGFDPIINVYNSSAAKPDDQEEEDDEEESYYSAGKLDSDQELNPFIISCNDHAMSELDNQKKEPDSRLDTTTHGGARSEMNMMIRRRKTLRDLFSEESDDEGMCSQKMMMMMSTTTNDSGINIRKPAPADHPPKKLGLLFFPKKLIIPADNESRSIKKLNQMLRRMVKRKIHPEIHGKPRKLEKEDDKSDTAPEAYASHRVGVGAPN